MGFREELKKARKAAGLTQQKLCDLTLIPKRTLEDWETGKFEPAPYIQRFLLNELKSLEKNCQKIEKNT